MVMADCREPPHVHVSGGGGAAKVWIAPISVAMVAGYSRREIQVIERIVLNHVEQLLERWDEECQQRG
jgi:hypothetical protein